MRGCDALLANLMPFRNALEPDSGTVFELGMAFALGKPVAGVLPRCGSSYEDKVIERCGIARDRESGAWDGRFGFLVEEFGQPANLSWQDRRGCSKTATPRSRTSPGSAVRE